LKGPEALALPPLPEMEFITLEALKLTEHWEDYPQAVLLKV
jgi:hypothetical protein